MPDRRLAPCPKCGKIRLTHFRQGKPLSKGCHKCIGPMSDKTKAILSAQRVGQAKPSIRGDKHPNWQGGKPRAYTLVRIVPTDPFVSMASKRRLVPQHRLVMARHLGRPLLPVEKVHHLNGIKTDNRIENLKLVSPADHAIYNELCSHCLLRKEIRLLRWQLKQLNEALQEKLRL